MCRIFGRLNYSTSSMGLNEVACCDDSLSLLAHGGPDDSGVFKELEDGIYMGHRRLSILDLSEAGHQPLIVENFVIAYNGEIYNFKEIKKELIDIGLVFTTESDTEVLLKSFLTWKYEAVNKFRGMFAFAIWDTKIKKLTLCRDRIGVKPLYYYHKDGFFLFSSELKAISRYPGLDFEIDMSSVSRFLKVGYIKSPYSIFKYVKKVIPGSFLEIGKNQTLKSWPYWSLNNIKSRSITTTKNEILNEAEKLIIDNCKYRMVSDVPVGVFLSGGIDSSLVTSILTEHHSSKIKTFTIGFEDKAYNEANYAKPIADFLNTDHNEWILTDEDFKNSLSDIYNIYDEPFGDSSAIPTYLVSRFAKSQVTVALSADGGDEVFGGYDRYRITEKFNKKIQYIPANVRKLMTSILSSIGVNNIDFLLKVIGADHYRNGIQWRMPKLINGLSALSVLDFYEQSQSMISDTDLKKLHLFDPVYTINEERQYFDSSSLISSLGKIDASSYLEGDILTKVDRATMAVALEGREPLLDHTLIEFGLSLPNKYKISNGKNKILLRAILEKRLPNNLIDRPKKGFSIPIQKWLKTILRKDLLEMKSNLFFTKQFSLDQKELDRIISKFLNDEGNINPNFIWNLHMLYKWYTNYYA